MKVRINVKDDKIFMLSRTKSFKDFERLRTWSHSIVSRPFT